MKKRYTITINLESDNPDYIAWCGKQNLIEDMPNALVAVSQTLRQKRMIQIIIQKTMNTKQNNTMELEKLLKANEIRQEIESLNGNIHDNTIHN